MIQYSKTSQFPEDGLIVNFSGKNHEEALKEATKWAGRANKTLVGYYNQVAFGKSVLVIYQGDKNETTDSV